MQSARAGSSGSVSNTVALKLDCASGSSGLERMGLEGGGLEKTNCIWRGLDRLDSNPKSLKTQRPFGSNGLERIGFEHCGREASWSIWLERARAKGQKA